MKENQRYTVAAKIIATNSAVFWFTQNNREHYHFMIIIND